MNKTRLGVLVLLLGCGAPAPAKSPHTPSCIETAVVATKPPPSTGWKLTGHVELLSANGQLSMAHAKDSAGKTLGSHAISNAEQAHAAILTSICEAGGVGASSNETNEPKADVPNQQFMFDVYAPTAEDPRGDLDAMCRAPDGEKASSAFGGLEVAHRELAWVTSTRWRTWQTTTERAILDAKDEASAKKIAHERARELDKIAAAEGHEKCWYVRVLAEFGDEPKHKDHD